MDALKSYFEVSPFFFTLTASASLLFFISNMSFIFGVDGADELLTGGDHVPSEAAFKFFSIQTILAFFMGLGWAGITSTLKWNFPFHLALVIGVLFGLLLMSFSAFLMFQVQKLNHTSRSSLYSALGSSGRVYLEIPQTGEGSGKVEVVVSGQQKIITAISISHKIPSFQKVEVVGVKDKDTLIVRPLIETGEEDV